MGTPGPRDIYQVRIEHPSGGVELHHFPTEEEADDYATFYYTGGSNPEPRTTITAIPITDKGGD